jgi:hypothetical protein
MTKERSPGAEVLTNRQMDPHNHTRAKEKPHEKGVTKSGSLTHTHTQYRVGVTVLSLLLPLSIRNGNFGQRYDEVFPIMLPTLSIRRERERERWYSDALD